MCLHKISENLPWLQTILTANYLSAEMASHWRHTHQMLTQSFTGVATSKVLFWIPVI